MIAWVPVGLPKELKKNKAPRRDKDSSPVPKLILFVQIFSVHDGTDQLILSTIFRQEGQIETPSGCYSAKQWFLPKLYKWDMVWETDYETTSIGLQWHTAICGNIMKQNRFLHKLWLLYFPDNSYKPHDNKQSNYKKTKDDLWYMEQSLQ